MKKTISTHNGSIANRDHNIRNPKVTDSQKHIDKSLLDQNEILHDEKHREAYQRIFGQALDEYNQKQKRPERQIKDYYNHVCKDSKRHPVYEMIIQVGDRSNTGVNAPIERECLKEFYMGWKKRNPNLECIGAYIHADEKEGTLHMHLDYIPVAHGYKKGLSIQNGLVKALKEQGFEKQGKATAQIQWEARENSALEEICNTHGIEIIHPERERKEHLSVQQYKQQVSIQETTEQLNKLKHVTRQKERHSKKLEKKETALSEILKKKQIEIEKLSQELKNLEENIFVKKQIERELDEKNAITLQSFQKAQKELQEIEVNKSISNDKLKQIQAKYDAQKAYFEQIECNLLAVKEEKAKAEQKLVTLQTEIENQEEFRSAINKELHRELPSIQKSKKFLGGTETAQSYKVRADQVMKETFLQNLELERNLKHVQRKLSNYQEIIKDLEEKLKNANKTIDFYKNDSESFQSLLEFLGEHQNLAQEIYEIMGQKIQDNEKENTVPLTHPSARY